MEKLPLIGHMVVFNEASFIEASIRSALPYLDQLIVIEGAWGTAVKSNGGISRSNDGTLEILQKLVLEYGEEKLRIVCANESVQLIQRSLHFQLFPKAHWLFILDGDEIYEPSEMKKVVEATKRTDADYFCTTSLTFVNDAFHYCPIDWPRLFRIDGPGYKFRSPNHLLNAQEQELRYCDKPIAKFHHYSYVHPSDRMLQKIRDRIETHSEFKWELHGNWIKRKGTSAKLLEYNHVPEILKDHPLTQHRAPAEAFDYKEPEKFGLLIHSGMGNLILATPMLKALRAWKPEARISILTWDRGANILHGWNVVNEIITKNHAHFIHSIGGLDYLLISPTAAIKDPSILGQSKHIVELPSKNGVWAKHEAEYNMDLIKALGYNGVMPSPECYTPCKVETDGDYVVVSMAHLRTDHWHLKNIEDFRVWIDVCRHIVEEMGKSIILLGCEEDSDDATRLCESVSTNFVKNLCGQTDIKQAAAIIRQASAYIGIDGGLAHIAACFQVPSVIVWTFTNMIKNRPLNPQARLVANKCNKRMRCQHGDWQSCEHKSCRNIKPQDIIKKIKDIL